MAYRGAHEINAHARQAEFHQVQLWRSERPDRPRQPSRINRAVRQLMAQTLFWLALRLQSDGVMTEVSTTSS
jgi:hypothetical protein